MIEQETVLILGAGASLAYGFPDGETLKNEIYDTLKNRRNKVLNELATHDLMNRIVNKLKYAPEYSMDEFLEHEEDEEIVEFGKKAIAAILLPYEKEETIFYNFIKNKEGENKFHWYRHLWQKMNTLFEYLEKNLSVITFNYDRSLEYFLFTAYKNKFPGRKEEDYKNKLKSIPIIHVYGKLGYLPWEFTEGEKTVTYDYDWDKACDDNAALYEQRSMILTASKQIKIVHENEVINEALQIRTRLNHAERIYFLGFGFNPINLKRLIENVKVSNCDIRGTMYKLDQKDKREAQKIIKEFRPRTGWDWDLTFPNKTIKDFLSNNITL